MVVFLDRDGVINQDSPLYIKNPEEFHFIPGSPEAIALLCAHGFEVILITNQSAVGRGMMSLATLEAIFDKLRQGVAKAGGQIRDIFFCPHRPEAGCACRKPLPGLILDACKRYGIDPAKSVMVGDSAKDVACGRAAGCGTTILVATGNGPEALDALARTDQGPDLYLPDLLGAARWIVTHLADPAKGC